MASPDLKAIGASFSQLITAVMISRLVLNMRSVHVGYHDSGPSDMHTGRGIPNQSFLTRTIGNLGEDMYSTTPGEDRLESEIPLVNAPRRSEFSGNIQ